MKQAGKLAPSQPPPIAGQPVTAARRSSSEDPKAARRAKADLASYLAKQNPKPGPLFGKVLASKDHYASGINGALYVYASGVYVRAEAIVKKRIMEVAEEAWSRHIQNETEGWLAANSPALDIDVLGPNRINVRNGLLTWTGTGWVLNKHSPKFRTPIQFPVTFDPDAECPRYDAFLETSLPDPKVRALADEWMGFNLTSDYAFHKALMATGESGSGKSVYLEVLTALLGKTNVSSLALAELARDTFATADLYGKAANVCTDIDSAELRRTGQFKRLVAGESIRAQEKHKPSFDFRNTAKLSFSANEIPSSRDTTSAFFSRWLVLIFPHRFRDTTRDIRNLRELIAADDDEMSGVLNRALDGLTRLRREGAFTGSRSTDEAKEFFRQRADGFAAWLVEIPEIDLGRKKRTDWFAEYKDWCQESGHYPLSSTKFYERARRWDGSLGVQIKAAPSKGFEWFRISRVVEGSSSETRYRRTRKNPKRGS